VRFGWGKFGGAAEAWFLLLPMYFARVHRPKRVVRFGRQRI
jgi:hypothetical protein